MDTEVLVRIADSLDTIIRAIKVIGVVLALIAGVQVTNLLYKK